MHGVTFLQDLAVVMLVAALVTLLFRRLQQPAVFGYIVAGLIISPYTPPFPLVKNVEAIEGMADLGVVFVMFSLGLEFSFRKLKAVGFPALVVAAFEILVVMWVGYSAARLMGWTAIEGLFLGIMLALTSSTIVIKALRDRGELTTAHGRLISGVSLFDDIFVIIVMILLPGFAKSGELAGGVLAAHLVKLFIFLVAAVVLGLLLVPRILRAVASYRSEEMLLITVLALCLGVSLLTVRMGYSPALGAFLVGAMIAESRELGHVVALTAPLRDLLAAVFFVAIGMLIQPSYLVTHAVPVFILLGVYLVAKVGACAFGAFLVGSDARTALRVGTGAAQIGEFAFILATLGVSLGVVGKHLYPIIVATAALNALVRPYLANRADAIADAVSRHLPRPLRAVMDLYIRWIAQVRVARQQQNPGLHHLRSLAWQLILNLALVAAVFICVAFVVRVVPAPDWLTRGGWLRTAAWSAAAVASLPLYVATVRKMRALAMMLAELAMSVRENDARGSLIRGIIENTAFVGQMVGLLFFTLALSSALLPPLHVLAVLLLAIGLLVFWFGPHFNRWYSRAKFALVETWNQPPPSAELRPQDVRPMPALLRDAQLETVTVTAGPTVGKLIRELALRTATGTSIVALERAGRTLVNPGPDEELKEGDKVLLLGDQGQLANAERLIREGPASP
jgi:CPA2 family monovalent cation:H+ antiporter-2